ncbi:Natterin-3 [Holothuria leucospilota]|uniref:Natterin-3 n=1 Tax=Holothuria leucospilota TaxID=206669 RepID=A0A9Q1HEH0_HOLLE|nr:Natterin-3 [Holothuria leucospilota]
MKSVLVLLVTISICQGSNPPIVFKGVQNYDWIYDDHDTGADRDLSIWRPNDLEYGYYPLGDVATASHDKPSTAAMMVKELTAGALSAPDSFTEIWNDRGSGGTHDVRIMQMNPPSGYTCLGHVAILGYSSTPDRNKYRCVRSEYVTTGQYVEIWLDRGSGADRDVGIWRNERGSSLDALDANTFTSFSNHGVPGGTPNMLSGQYAKNHLNVEISNENFIFTLYETSDMDEIWNDGGSGADRDVAIWRSKGSSNSYSLGDIAVGGGRPARGFVVKALRDDALRSPDDFRKIWDDSGSGADWDGAFYQPLCPHGYRTLGHVAMRNHHEKPPSNSVRCVKGEYTRAGQWAWVWNDAGSGADDDVTVWKAIPNGEGQGVEAMSTIRHHGGMNVGAYVLIPGQVNYVTGPPARRYILQNLQYLFDDRNLVNNEPENIQRTIVENRGDTVQQVTREVSYTYEETYSWSNTAGLEVSVSTTITTGVPLISSGGVTVSTTASFSHEWGGSTTKSYTDSVSVQVSVQPRSQKSAVIVGNRYTMDIPYTATLITEYEDGSRGVRNNYRGVFRGVQVNEIRVVYEADVPLTEENAVVEDAGGIDLGGIETGVIETGGIGVDWPPPFVEEIPFF